MARIPIERRGARGRGDGAWWWVLVVAVIGLVVWLVYEWFDNDYYEDSGYAVGDRASEIVGPEERLEDRYERSLDDGFRINREDGMIDPGLDSDGGFVIDQGEIPPSRTGTDDLEVSP